jgi:hypothetical protein
MKVLAASALALGLGLAGVSASQAMPISTIAPSQAEIVQVAQGCGPGMHRGPGGFCRPLYSCPPGWHPEPYGKRCYPNGRW